MKNGRKNFKKFILISYICFIYMAFNYQILGSETLQITTYYPAPYGGYARLLTTDMTLLARDTGNVGIGLTNPQKKLEVNGSIRLSNLSGRIGTQNYDPDSGYPTGWGGGIHTWDVMAEGSILARSMFCLGGSGTGPGDCITQWPRCYSVQYIANGTTSCSSINDRVVGFRTQTCSQWWSSVSSDYTTAYHIDWGGIGACGQLICCSGL